MKYLWIGIAIIVVIGLILFYKKVLGTFPNFEIDIHHWS